MDPDIDLTHLQFVDDTGMWGHNIKRSNQYKEYSKLLDSGYRAIVEWKQIQGDFLQCNNEGARENSSNSW